MKILLTFLILFFSGNLYSQWIIQNEDIDAPHGTNSICFTNNDKGYISCWNGKLYKTTNGGINWNAQIIAPGQILTSVFFLNNDFGVVTATNGIWLKTTDGGNTFSTNTNAGYGGSLQNMFFIDINTGWCVGGNAGGTNFVSKTTNGGSDWTVQRNFSEHETPYTVLFFNADTGITSCGHKIWLSTNGGANWNSQFEASNFINHFYFINETGYGVGENGTIVKTTNRGFNWAASYSPTNNKNLWQSYFQDENTGWITGDSGAIYYTTNGGSNYILQSSGTTKNLVSIAFNNGKGWVTGNINLNSPTGGIVLTYFPYLRLNVKILIEGMYSTLYNQTARRDTMRVYLRDVVSPYNIIDSAQGVIDSISFSGIFDFTNASTGTYYIDVKHFNSIETWSKSGGEILSTGSVNFYDFTTSASQSYGNNMIQKGEKYCIYSGDADQDGLVSLTDVLLVYNNSVNFVTGVYLPTDLNGDSVVDLTDLSLGYNNSVGFARVLRP